MSLPDSTPQRHVAAILGIKLLDNVRITKTSSSVFRVAVVRSEKLVAVREPGSGTSDIGNRYQTTAGEN
jgi:hypothetical protein